MRKLATQQDKELLQNVNMIKDHLMTTDTYSMDALHMPDSMKILAENNFIKETYYLI